MHPRRDPDAHRPFTLHQPCPRRRPLPAPHAGGPPPLTPQDTQPSFSGWPSLPRGFTAPPPGRPSAAPSAWLHNSWTGPAPRLDAQAGDVSAQTWPAVGHLPPNPRPWLGPGSWEDPAPPAAAASSSPPASIRGLRGRVPDEDVTFWGSVPRSASTGSTVTHQTPPPAAPRSPTATPSGKNSGKVPKNRPALGSSRGLYPLLSRSLSPRSPSGGHRLGSYAASHRSRSAGPARSPLPPAMSSPAPAPKRGHRSSSVPTVPTQTSSLLDDNTAGEPTLLLSPTERAGPSPSQRQIQRMRRLLEAAREAWGLPRPGVTPSRSGAARRPAPTQPSRAARGQASPASQTRQRRAEKVGPPAGERRTHPSDSAWTALSSAALFSGPGPPVDAATPSAHEPPPAPTRPSRSPATSPQRLRWGAWAAAKPPATGAPPAAPARVAPAVLQPRPAAPAAPPAAAQPHPAAHARPFAPRPCGAGPYGTDGLRGTSPAGGPAGGELAEPSLGMSSEPCIDGVPVQQYLEGIRDLYDRLKATLLYIQSHPRDFIADDTDERPPTAPLPAVARPSTLPAPPVLPTARWPTSAERPSAVAQQLDALLAEAASPRAYSSPPPGSSAATPPLSPIPLSQPTLAPMPTPTPAAPPPSAVSASSSSSSLPTSALPATTKTDPPGPPNPTGTAGTGPPAPPGPAHPLPPTPSVGAAAAPAPTPAPAPTHAPAPTPAPQEATRPGSSPVVLDPGGGDAPPEQAAPTDSPQLLSSPDPLPESPRELAAPPPIPLLPSSPRRTTPSVTDGVEDCGVQTPEVVRQASPVSERLANGVSPAAATGATPPGRSVSSPLRHVRFDASVSPGSPPGAGDSGVDGVTSPTLAALTSKREAVLEKIRARRAAKESPGA